jgi:tRNA nucleotidyltransferase (CCA-adding enzyme)
MPGQISLTGQIQKNLPAELVALIKQAASITVRKTLLLYLVGGIVRDLLLGQPNFDLDLVVEGDAIGLAKEIAEKVEGKLSVHKMFNTAKIVLDKWTIDIAMARTETYARPGALPVVAPGTLKTDLFRRDFTINAMAVSLNTDNYGELMDLYGGLNDLKKKCMRILHEKSFFDDATRIWRAVRYEQRLGFQIEPDTLRLLSRNVPLLKTVGGYRLRRELELVLKEKEPEKALTRAYELGVLKELHPSLKADEWLASRFRAARLSGKADPDFYVGLLTYRLTNDEALQITKFLRFSAEQVRVINEVRELIC